MVASVGSKPSAIRARRASGRGAAGTGSEWMGGFGSRFFMLVLDDAAFLRLHTIVTTQVGVSRRTAGADPPAEQSWGHREYHSGSCARARPERHHATLAAYVGMLRRSANSRWRSDGPQRAGNPQGFGVIVLRFLNRTLRS